MNHMTSPFIQIIARFETIISWVTKLIGLDEFLPSSNFLAQAGDIFCSDNSLTQFVCTNSLFVLCGFNIKQMNTELLPVIMGHTPAGSSTKQFLHYAQLVKSGKFRQYDYGLRNLLKYKSLFPPKYDLSKVTAPVALMYSHNDWLAAEDDVLTLYGELANKIGRFLVSDSQFNHLDYLWGRDADTLVYYKVFSLMTKY
ncbi:Lipase 4 [Carabus blaptoides fortunei]